MTDDSPTTSSCPVRSTHEPTHRRSARPLARLDARRCSWRWRRPRSGRRARAPVRAAGPRSSACRRTSLPAGQPSTVTVTGTRLPRAAARAGRRRVRRRLRVLRLGRPAARGGRAPATRPTTTACSGTRTRTAATAAVAAPATTAAARVRLVSFTAGRRLGRRHAVPHGRQRQLVDDAHRRGLHLHVHRSRRPGSRRRSNCQQTQCGVFTIGAHGIASATNERFVPDQLRRRPRGRAAGRRRRRRWRGDRRRLRGGSGDASGGASGGTDPATGATGRPVGPHHRRHRSAGDDRRSRHEAEGPTGSKDDPIELAASNASSTESSSSMPLIAGVAVLVLLLAGGSTWFWRRRHAGGEP